MHKTIKIFLLIIGLAFSCEEGKDCCTHPCDVNNPAENLPWLKAEIDSWKSTGELYKYFYVEQGNYFGQPVFIMKDCCPFCNTITPVLDCKGEVLWYAYSEPDKTALITDLKIIWKSDDLQCDI